MKRLEAHQHPLLQFLLLLYPWKVLHWWSEDQYECWLLLPSEYRIFWSQSPGAVKNDKDKCLLLMATEKEQINIMLMDESYVHLSTFSEFLCNHFSLPEIQTANFLGIYWYTFINQPQRKQDCFLAFHYKLITILSFMNYTTTITYQINRANLLVMMWLA